MEPTEAKVQQHKDQTIFKYQGELVPPEYVFITRRYVFAMVCPQAVTDGHVLICPMRFNLTSLSQLTELETLEIFVCAKEICRVFEDVFKVRNFMILLQDGPSSASF